MTHVQLEISHEKQWKIFECSACVCQLKIELYHSTLLLQCFMVFTDITDLQ